MMFGIFSTPVDNFYALFREMSVLVLCLYLKQGYLWGFLVFVWYWIVGVLYILILTSYQIYGLQTFSPFCMLLFYSVDCFLCYAKSSEFDVVSPVRFCFYAYAFDVILKKSLPIPMSKYFYPMFPSSSFRASSLMFKPLSYFELIFFLIVYSSLCCQNSVNHIYVDLFLDFLLYSIIWLSYASTILF